MWDPTTQKATGLKRNGAERHLNGNGTMKKFCCSINNQNLKIVKRLCVYSFIHVFSRLQFYSSYSRVRV